jgi:protein-S-isoprenylcysteine O-methyltransferase Ste14
MASIDGHVSEALGTMERVILLRVALLLGLILHKVVWEALKAGSRRASSSPQRAPGLLKRLVKLVKSLALIFLVIQTLFLDILPISAALGGWRALGVVIYTLGLALALAGRLALGRNWTNVEDARVLPEQLLVTDGIYRYVRHPIYTGDAMLLIGLELALNSWLFVLMVIPLLIFVRQALSEEMLLVETFPEYDAYRKRSKGFIPFVI